MQKGRGNFTQTMERLVASQLKSLASPPDVMTLPFLKRHRAVIAQALQQPVENVVRSSALTDLVKSVVVMRIVVSQLNRTATETDRETAFLALWTSGVVPDMVTMARRLTPLVFLTVSTAEEVDQTSFIAAVTAVVEIVLTLTTMTSNELTASLPASVAAARREWTTSLTRVFCETLKAYVKALLAVHRMPDPEDDTFKPFRLNGALDNSMTVLTSLYSVWGLRNLTSVQSYDRELCIQLGGLSAVLELLSYLTRIHLGTRDDHKRHGPSTDKTCGGCQCVLAQDVLLAVEQSVAFVKNMCTAPALPGLTQYLSVKHHADLVVAVAHLCVTAFTTHTRITSQTYALLSLVTDEGMSKARQRWILPVLLRNEHQPLLKTLVQTHLPSDGQGDVGLTESTVRLLGNLVGATEASTPNVSVLVDQLISHGCLDKVFGLMQCQDKPDDVNPALLRKEAAWILSNCCTSSELAACRVLSWKNFSGIRRLVDVIRTDPVMGVRREAVWATVNAAWNHRKFRPLIMKFDLISAWSDFIHSSMAVWGDTAEAIRVTEALMDLCAILLTDQEARVNSSARGEIQNMNSFCQVFVPDAEESAVDLMEKHFPDAWTDLETMD